MLVYQRTGDPDRAARVATMLALLGYADAAERSPVFRASLKRGTLSDELRRARLLPAAAQGPLTDALLAVRETLDGIYGAQAPAGAVPIAQVNDPALKVCVVDALRLFGVGADVYIAPEVPGGVLLVDAPRPACYVAAQLPMSLPDGERRFLFGRALEPLRGGYAILMRLRPQQRLDVAHLVGELLKPEAAREPAAHEFARTLSRKSLKALERLQGAAPIPGLAPGMSAPVAEIWLAGFAQ